MKTRVYISQSLVGRAGYTIDTPSRVHYLTRVLRIRKHEQIIVFDSTARQYLAQVEGISRQAISLSIHQQIEQGSESPLRITLGQSISRGRRMDYTIQKATELGVSSITPLYTALCQVTTCDQKRIDHWSAIACHASEQSGRVRIPEINAPQSLTDWLHKTDEQVRLVLHHCAHAVYDFSCHTAPQSLAVLIGPEGGLRQSEVLYAQQYGFVAVQFGPRVLRTETAAPVALALAQWHWGDFRV